MRAISLVLLCAMAISCNAYRYGSRNYRNYRNYRGYNDYDRRLGYGSGSTLALGGHGGHGSHGSHAHVSPGVGINHVDTEVTHIPHGDHVHTITRKVPHVYAGNSQTQVIHGPVGPSAHGPLASGLGLSNGPLASGLGFANGPLASGLGLAQGPLNPAFGQGPLSPGFGMAQGPLGTGLGFNGRFGPRGPIGGHQGGFIANQIRESHIHDAHAHDAAVREAHIHDAMAHDSHAHDAHGHDAHEIHRGMPGPFFQTGPGIFQRSLG